MTNYEDKQVHVPPNLPLTILFSLVESKKISISTSLERMLKHIIQVVLLTISGVDKDCDWNYLAH